MSESIFIMVNIKNIKWLFLFQTLKLPSGWFLDIISVTEYLENTINTNYLTTVLINNKVLYIIKKNMHALWNTFVTYCMKLTLYGLQWIQKYLSKVYKIIWGQVSKVKVTRHIFVVENGSVCQQKQTDWTWKLYPLLFRRKISRVAGSRKMSRGNIHLIKGVPMCHTVCAPFAYHCSCSHIFWNSFLHQIVSQSCMVAELCPWCLLVLSWWKGVNI